LEEPTLTRFTRLNRTASKVTTGHNYKGNEKTPISALAVAGRQASSNCPVLEGLLPASFCTTLAADNF